MELIIDANVLISSLIATKGRTFDLIFDDNIKLFSIDFLFSEIEKHKEDILSKSKLSEPDFKMFLSLVSSRIEIIPYSDFKKFVSSAEKMCPDPKDIEYFALALKKSCALWSNDRALQNQKTVAVYSTTELLNLFKMV